VRCARRRGKAVETDESRSGFWWPAGSEGKRGRAFLYLLLASVVLSVLWALVVAAVPVVFFAVCKGCQPHGRRRGPSEGPAEGGGP
jgi:hypothetical protein